MILLLCKGDYPGGNPTRNDRMVGFDMRGPRLELER